MIFQNNNCTESLVLLPGWATDATVFGNKFLKQLKILEKRLGQKIGIFYNPNKADLHELFKELAAFNCQIFHELPEQTPNIDLAICLGGDGTKKLQINLQNILDEKNRLKDQKEFLKFQKDELEKLNLQLGEYHELETKYKQLVDLDKITSYKNIFDSSFMQICHYLQPKFCSFIFRNP